MKIVQKFNFAKKFLYAKYSLFHIKGIFGVTIVFYYQSITKYRFGRPATDGNLLYEICVSSGIAIDYLWHTANWFIPKVFNKLKKTCFIFQRPLLHLLLVDLGASGVHLVDQPAAEHNHLHSLQPPRLCLQAGQRQKKALKIQTFWFRPPTMLIYGQKKTGCKRSY